MKINENFYLDFSSIFGLEKFRAGFSLKSYFCQPPEDRITFAKILNLNAQNLVIPQQMHTANVECNLNPRAISKTDGIISSTTDLVLSIQVADCLPIFYLDKVTQEFGLIHAGWRGIAKGIMESFFKKINGSLANKYFIIGPSIRKCCFEVGSEVALQFPNAFLSEGKGDRWNLDLQSTVKQKMLNHGTINQNINEIEECTCCNADKYHSYRRDGTNAGRMIAIAGWL